MDDTTLWVTVIAQSVAFGVLSSLAASRKNRGAGAWFAIGLLFGVFGFAAALLVGPAGAANPATDAADVDSAVAADFAAMVSDKGKTGIVLDRSDGRTVSRVSAGSSADVAGLLPGDRLIAIDGELCEGDYRQVVMRLVGDANTTVTVSVRRGDERYDFELTRT